MTDRQDPKEALASFVQWLRDNRCEKFWCQGATFDPVILEFALSHYGLSLPWKFWNVRDTRTAYDVLGFNAKSVPREGVYHSALDDCKHQIKCLRMAMKQ